MTYLAAAVTILKDAGQPLRPDEITQRALAQKLISPQGLTPEATMASRLYIDTLQDRSRFVRAGNGGLRPCAMAAGGHRVRGG
jgi:restriction system protein